MATKLGAVAKCVFVELLHGCRGGWSEIKSFHRLEVSSLVLYKSSSIRKNQRKRLFNFIIHLKIIQPFFPSKIAPRKLRSECQSGGDVSDLSFNCVRSQKQWD